ncbi:MAG TPA: YihY/virulence factor BrkB family protein [Tepidisphaeraceae bacterium]|nr:YihY/virulence factor BrkB family protein [Tepidisphaeraceae bacterium]
MSAGQDNLSWRRRLSRAFTGALYRVWCLLHPSYRQRVTRVHGMLVQTVVNWWNDRVPSMGAALSFYTTLALAPLVLLVTPIAGLLFGEKSAKTHVVQEFTELVGTGGRGAVQHLLTSVALAGTPGPWLKMFNVIVLLFAASGVFSQLQESLDLIWRVVPQPGRSALLIYLRKRFLSFAMVIVLCFLLLVSLLFSAGLQTLHDLADERAKAAMLLWLILHDLVSFGVVMVLFALVYKVLPDVTIRWRDVWIGAAITSLLFAAGRAAIGTYLGHSRIGSFYGAGGSAVVLLIWVYYSAQVVLLGAEFTRVYARRHHEVVVPEREVGAVRFNHAADAGAALSPLEQLAERKGREQHRT